jgi:hypothetical protein
MMPKLSVSICGNDELDPVLFIGLHGLCMVLVYIYA